MRLKSVLAFLVVIFSCSSVWGQGFTSDDAIVRKHRDFGGKPCLQTSGVARPMASNPRIINHSVSLDNHCNDRIKVKVCYYKTDECKDVDVPPHTVKEQAIGVFPAMQMFRYEVKEQF